MDSSSYLYQLEYIRHKLYLVPRDLRGAHKAQSPAQPNPQMGWEVVVLPIETQIYIQHQNINIHSFGYISTPTDQIIFKSKIRTHTE
ncbi:hypothetical protein ACN38_g7959 [Penicillium nordicum]|uniref:Uncharacterized protein n=1 Tax=Penicillium nordicum TaxID=229535 RepID=A0A0M9WDX2_9EURO|nr:hypothetical protein ACN38_g7959 [Penicillium nordicum]